MIAHQTSVVVRFEIASFQQPSETTAAGQFAAEIRAVLADMARRHNFSLGELHVTTSPSPKEAQ